MKTIAQLLFLTKNPHYKLTNDEQAVLDDFLLMKQAEESKRLQKKSSKRLEKLTNVRVRNIVEKTIIGPEEFEEVQDGQKTTE